ncbi:MAG TPA: hypothetical protein VMT16_11710, partial [Thermoanaerobaculia bacterium]|nr:hypothetical protein [Thermoanaerobaculia bacterium]
RAPAGRARRRLLGRLRHAVAAGPPRQAAADVETAWRDFLGERWGIPPGVPSTQWGEQLRRRGVTAPAAEELVRLMDDVHYLRYAPQLAATECIQGELWERCRRLARLI